MSLTTSAKTIFIITIIWMLTLGRSLVIMLGGKRIFKKASKGERTAFYPFVNLFTMLEVTDISLFFGILLFVPGINVIILAWMSYKLGYVFNTGFLFRIGLVLLPFLFYPILAFSDKSYKLTDEEYFKALDNTNGKSLMIETPEEKIEVPVVDDNDEPEEEVDSVFKGNFEMSEKAAPYKAVKIDLLGMEKLKDNDMDDVFDEQDIIRRPKEETKEEKKKDFEMIDL